MSKYLKALDPIVRVIYLEKLQLVGQNENEDPYEFWKCGRFEDNMTRWPPIEYGHIFCHFVEHLGVFTKQELIKWKTFVHTIIFRIGMFVMSDCAGYQLHKVLS